MLFEDHRGRERRLETVRGVMANHAAKRALRRAFRRRFGVIRQCVKKLLDLAGRSQPLDDAAFAARKSGQWWLDRADRRGARPAQCARLIASISSADVHSFPLKISRKVPSGPIIAVRRL